MAEKSGRCDLRVNEYTASLVQALFRRRRHQPRRPPPAKIRPGRPAPATGPGTADGSDMVTVIRSSVAVAKITLVDPTRLANVNWRIT